MINWTVNWTQLESKFTKDYVLGIKNEERVVAYLESLWYKIERNEKMSVHDFIIVWDKGKAVNVELKTRRVAYWDYDTTLIGANKLAEAWKKYYSDWEETLFFFSYTDWLYLVNPLEVIPFNKEYKLARWDRGIDKPKGWLYYHTKDLKKVI